MQDQRAASLLHFLTTHRAMTMKQLETALKFSRRQIQYDIQKINAWLKDENLPEIFVDRNRGIIVDEAVKEAMIAQLHAFNKRAYIASPEERVDLLLIQTFMSPKDLSVNHYTSLLQVSRNTALTTVTQARIKANEARVALSYSRADGYQLTGETRDVRQLIMTGISHFMHYREGKEMLAELYETQSQQSFDATLASYRQVLSAVERQLHVAFVEEKARDMAAFLLILRQRTATKTTITYDEDTKVIIRGWTEYQAIAPYINELGFNVEKTDEHYYAAVALLGLQIQGDTELNEPNTHKDLYELTKAIVQEFELQACVSLPDKTAVIHSLYAHIRPAYYRMLFQIPIVNPLLPRIKKEYPELFKLVKRSLKLLSEYVKHSIPDEETGYITLHFGSLMEEENLHITKKRALIICPNGVGASNMLRYQIEKLIPEINIVAVQSLNDYDFKKETDIDVLFSTVAIQTELPLIIVNPILSALDKARIIQEVDDLFIGKRGANLPGTRKIMEIVQAHASIHDELKLQQALSALLAESAVVQNRRYSPVLSDLLKIEMIQVQDGISDWQAAITKAAEPLLTIQAIEPHYIDAMINNVQELGPYIVMAPNVAIPHARPEDGVKKLSMSLLKLNEPVSFSPGDANKDAQLVFVLAAVDNESHLKALSQLTELLEEESRIDKMLEFQTAESFCR